MRITVLSREDGRWGPCDIEVPLTRLAASSDPLTAARWQKLLELARHLRSGGPAPEAWGFFVRTTLFLSPAGQRTNRANVELWTDWREHGPVQDGLPVLHYRMQIKRPGAALSEDMRTDDPEEVRQALYRAFGWSS